MTGPVLAEWEQVASRFGVGMEQVRRDHLISHVLAAVSSDVPSDDLVFFGGTALSRTHLADARLSEDIDLIAQIARNDVAEQIERAVRRGIARSHGRPTWEPALTATVGSQPSVLSVADGTSVQVQLLSGDGYSWPTEVMEMEQRYSDAPPARLRVLTPDAFAAAKLGAWIDRGTPRDLYDLWAMSERGLIGPSALRLFIAHGPFGTPPAAWVFDRVLDEGAWTRALGHQTQLRVSALEAMTVVREAWLGTAT
jgi:predicted nucleotidyltransferase component of viral defense system